MFKRFKEKKFFHNELRKICNNNKKNYNKYKNWCDKYFYLAHRNESRGIGGIFFDYENGIIGKKILNLLNMLALFLLK